MIYLLDYTTWLIVCSVFFCIIFILNLRKRWITGLLLCIVIGFMFFPKLLPTVEQVVLTYDKSERELSDGLVLDNGNLISYKDNVYYLNEELKLQLEPGFYDRVDVLTIKSLKFNIKGDIIIQVKMDETLKYIYIKD